MDAHLSDKYGKGRTLLPLIALFALLWTAVVAASLAWNTHKSEEEVRNLARQEALAMFNKDMGFRLWGTRHGGIYVPVSEHTQPSPYLAHIPERDIETPSGKKLTLMNPAFMVRQLMSNYNELYGTRGHITGLVLLRPENAPDEWETKALKSFINDGVEEITEITEIDNKPFLRLMRPMIMTEGCEKCHGHLGFREGDIRGGVSVAIPMISYFEREAEQKKVLYATHGAVWFIGLLLIGFGGNKIQTGLHETLKAEKEVRELNHALEQRVQERTKKLEEKEERLRMTVENAADGIIVINEKGIIDTFNESAQRIFGYNPDEVIGKDIAILMPREEGHHHQKYVDHLLKTNHAKVLGMGREVTARRKNGDLFPLHLAVSQTSIEDRILFSAICRDLSIEKKTAHELLLAKKEAELANQAKSEFLASMSHELRTPLNSIIGFSQLLNLGNADPLSSNQRDKVLQIHNAGQHLLSLINDILDLSRIETQGFSLSLEPVDIKVAIKDCLTLIAPEAKKRNIRICDNTTDQDLPPAYADFVRLKQVLMNLLSNALKYNIKGGQITLSTETHNGYIKISITDTGAGIADNQLEQVFLPFNRLGHENGEIEGTGIGLSITKKLIETMNGRISIESVVNQGSTFSIEIPVCISVQDAENGIKTMPVLPVGHWHILYIDDNEANCALLRDTFAHYDAVEFSSAATGEEGINLAYEDIPDIILMDLNLPGMDGFSSLQILQNDDATCDIPVIALSANRAKNQKQTALRAGFQSYISKPFDLEDVISAIALILERQHKP
jgi:PAS domain S-box-containing protein